MKYVYSIDPSIVLGRCIDERAPTLAGRMMTDPPTPFGPTQLQAGDKFTPDSLVATRKYLELRQEQGKAAAATASA